MMIGYSFLEEECVGGVTEKFLLNCIIVRAIGSQRYFLNLFLYLSYDLAFWP